MQKIQIFNNAEFGEIRTVMIDGEPWFVSKDISEKLGYAKPANMVKLVDEDDKRNLRGSDLEPGSKAQISAVNESGLYAAIFGSKQENAKKFKKWVTSEVLPSIRKTGEYKQENTGDVQGQIKLLAQGTTELYQRVDEVTEDVKTVKQEIESLRLDLPILPIEADRITNAVKAKGVSVMGGKNSNAYRNRSIVNKVYRDIYRQIYRNFEVSTYKALKRNQCDMVIEIVGKYELPVVLKDQIEQCNAQQKLNLKGGE